MFDRQIVAYIIDGLWIFWGVYWLAKSFGNKRTVYRRGRGLRLIYLAVVVFAWYVAERHGLVPHIRLYHETFATQILGVGLCAAGIALALWARRVLGTNWSGVVTLKENHELIQSGPYGYVRHPIYSGILLGILGSLIALAPFIGSIFVLALALFTLKVKSLMEEKIMLETFPEQYPQYMQQVRSLIPHVW